MSEESASSYQNRAIRISGDAALTDLRLKSARVVESLSRLTEVTADLLAKDRSIDLKGLVGKQMCIEVDGPDGNPRRFCGLCISAEYLGPLGSFGLVQVEIRPRLWFLTHSSDNRVFQDKTTFEIVQQVLSDRGFTDLRSRLSGSYAKRDFCLQYRETDYVFLSRLMEEEGIYFYFDHGTGRDVLVLADSVSGHDPFAGGAIDYFPAEESFRRANDHVFEWTNATRSTTGKVTLWDYDFEAPARPVTSVKSIPGADQPAKSFEHYRYPGRYRDKSPGDDSPVDPVMGQQVEKSARVRMEAEAIRSRTFRGACNVRHLKTGQTFKMKGNARAGDTEFLLTGATTQIRIEHDDLPYTVPGLLPTALTFEGEPGDSFLAVIEAVPKTEQYRAPLTTPWPEMHGIQTAVVVGPSGEEIHTDKFGRVRIQFMWDRVGKGDQESSVWVRAMMPWTGSKWGMIAIPRVGQEVIVQFEEGNPDRPIIVGMLYNAATMPPYALPANKTQSGIKTNSSKGGGGFNELVFEDLKGKEFVRLQSEKDFTQIVKNNATITIGTDKKDPGDLTTTIYHNMTETVQTGDHTFKVEKGSQTIAIKTDKTEAIEGKSDLTVTGNVTTTVKTGNVTTTVDTGNVSETVKTGNVTLDVKLGKVEISAMQSITLKVGGSSVVVDQMGVTIKGPMIKIEAEGMIDAKAPMTQVKGDGMLILKGGITMIN